MKAVSVSVCKNDDKVEIFRVWLILTDFIRENNGTIKQIKNNYNGKSIIGIFKITKGDKRGSFLNYQIPISGINSNYGRKIIRDIMEASGFAKIGSFESYSVSSYDELINLHFPAYINNTRICEVINPYKSLTKLEKSYEV